MSRGMTHVLLLTIGVVAFANQAWGSCSQFGHSCFGAHGKRSGDQFDNLMAAAAAPGPYPVANQVPELEPKLEEQRVPFDDGAVIRSLMAILGHRSRQRSSSSSQQPTPNMQPYNYLKAASSSDETPEEAPRSGWFRRRHHQREIDGRTMSAMSFSSDVTPERRVTTSETLSGKRDNITSSPTNMNN